MLTKKYLDKTILFGTEQGVLSLSRGLAGKALFFYMLAKHMRNRHFKEYAGQLVQYIFDEINCDMPISFMNGLAGIGWCIQYLLLSQLEEGNANEILSELDNVIMEYNPMRVKDLSFEMGLRGIVAYVRARIDGSPKNVPFDKSYLVELQNACKLRGIKFHSPDFEVNHIYKRLLQHYATIPEEKLMPWEVGILQLSFSMYTFTNDCKATSGEQQAFEEMIETSDKGCALIFTQTSRAAKYGIGTYVEQLAQCLIEAGWDVCILELDCYEKEDSFQLFYGAGYYKLSQPNVKENLREYNYSQFVIHHFSNKVGRVVCHFNFALYPNMVERIKTALHAKIIFTLHFTSWSFDLSGDKERLIRILEKQCDDWERHVHQTFLNEQKFMMEHCDKVIAIAQHSYNMIKNVYSIPKNRIVLIPNGRTCLRYSRDMERRRSLRERYGFRESETILVFCGRLDAIKGIVNLMDAFRILSSRHEGLRLLVIGEGNFKVCMKYAEGLWNKIMFTGFLEKDRIMELYTLADIGIVPSIHEEFGYVALEMMMAGLPIIANKTTGLTDLTEDGKYGLLYEHDKPLEDVGFIPTMERVLSGKQAIPRADLDILEEKYSIDTFKRKIIALYHSI